MEQNKNNMMWQPTILSELLNKEVVVDTEEKINTAIGKHQKPKFEDGMNFYSGILKSFDAEFILLEDICEGCKTKQLVAIKRNIITTIREWRDHDTGGDGSHNDNGGIPQTNQAKPEESQQAKPVEPMMKSPYA